EAVHRHTRGGQAMQRSPVVGSRIDALLETAWRAGGTDLLLSVGTAPQVRIEGNLVPVPGTPLLSGFDLDGLLAELLTPDQASAWKVDGEYDFSFSWRQDARVRANAFSQRGQLALSLRLIPMRIPT